MASTGHILSVEAPRNKQDRLKIAEVRQHTAQDQRRSATIFSIESARSARDSRRKKPLERADDALLSVRFARRDGLPPPWSRRLSLALDRWVVAREAAR